MIKNEELSDSKNLRHNHLNEEQKKNDRAQQNQQNLNINTPGKTIANGRKIEIVRDKDDGSS